MWFHCITGTRRCPKSPTACIWGRGQCALSGVVGLVLLSLVLMRQRSGVPFGFGLSDGQGYTSHSNQLSGKCVAVAVSRAARWKWDFMPLGQDGLVAGS